MMKKISIIIPVYNCESWLSRCIDSVINQTYKNLEIILVNDGSVDNSINICKHYESIDSRIVLINKENGGTSSARNRGLSISTGDYIQFVDSDDSLKKDACEKLIEYMIKSKSEMVICGLNVYQNGKLLRTPHLKEKKINIKDSFENFKYIYPVFASPCNKLYKKSLIKEYFDESLSAGEDMKFNLTYIKNIQKIITIEECLYNVNLDNQNSLNRRFREDRLDLFLEQNKLEFLLCEDLYGSNYDKYFLSDKCMNGVHSHFRNICMLKNKKEAIKVIKKYLNESYIVNASKKAKTDRLDYNIFNKLIRFKSAFLIYSFFKLKFKILDYSNK
ncbi:glycosyltransferase family 2 protein [Romboutsia timonensis]|uniref:glycosyltransferase family 2 protein n=1 Tax=Romboutsia timonensis TaxID=1776391 RepID=UPI002A7EADBC|nr:glycosyltransferase family 2 protein [Romboutsia timonensis]MDY3959684.1 glycosyltransferase family 2 protein [Romboutsia timonensis]